MTIPRIDISTLPDDDLPIALYGSSSETADASGSDDSLIILMTFLYNIA
ncbi:hypothetical protein [Novosphingobium sp. PC22D]|nr:hypothetical protein [Novosphingobium sp. PC22D]